jgi:hypothetical protein
MRYFRVTINPASNILNQDGEVHLRLQLPLSNEMIDADFHDGQYLSVEDGDMGAFGPHLDFLRDTDGPDGLAGAYFIFQESQFEDIPDIALQSMLPANSLRVASNQ